MQYEVETDGSIKTLPQNWKKRGVCRKGDIFYFSEMTMNLINIFPVKDKPCRVCCGWIPEEYYYFKIEQIDKNTEMAMRIFEEYLHLSLKSTFYWEGIIMDYNPEKGIAFEVYSFSPAIAWIRAEQLRQNLMRIYEEAFFQMEID